MSNLPRVALSVLLVLTAICVLSVPARADVTATDVAQYHEDHGHDQWRHGEGTRGHRWTDYQRQARQIRAYLRAVARAQFNACANDPHCGVRLASYISHAPYRLVDRVVQCESRYDPNASNPSGAGGLGQWLPSSWNSYAPDYGMGGRSRFSVWPAAWVTASVIDDGGIGNWNASRGCWG